MVLHDNDKRETISKRTSKISPSGIKGKDARNLLVGLDKVSDGLVELLEGSLSD